MDYEEEKTNPTISPTKKNMNQTTSFGDDELDSFYVDEMEEPRLANKNTQEEDKPAVDHRRTKYLQQTRETSLVYTFKDFMSSPSELSEQLDSVQNHSSAEL